MTVIMGRTKRKRSKRLKQKIIDGFDAIISLQKSLKVKFPNLKVSYFDDTGRGIKCLKKIQEGDVLISLPLSHLITSKVYKDSLSELNIENKSAQFILSVWLVNEAHLKNESKYINYIQSLPQYYTNLFFCTEKEASLLPDFLHKELRDQKNSLKKIVKDFHEVLENKSCPHCGYTLRDIYSFDKLIWGWFTVNTRSVYYNDKSNSESLALAPFLDLFNHSNEANTKMIIDYKNELYIIKTLVSFKKAQQVFIKYGSHSNLKLLAEYGFIVPNNCHDFVEFTFEEVIRNVKEFYSSCGELTTLKYNFIKTNKLNENLIKNKEEFSWNLHGLVYVLLIQHQDFSVIKSKVYSNDFTFTEWDLIHRMENIIAIKKLKQLENHFKKMEIIEDCTLSFTLAKNLIKIYIEILKSNIYSSTDIIK